MGGAHFLFGRGAGIVWSLLGNASGGGTVLVGKCLRSQYGFHSAKRPAVVQVQFKTVSGRYRFAVVWVKVVVKVREGLGFVKV